MTMTKIFIQKYLNLYFKIIRLETAFKSGNLFYIIFIICIGLITIIFRDYLFEYFSNNYYIIQSLYFAHNNTKYNLCAKIYICYRVSLTLFKGIPYFFHQVLVLNLGKKNYSLSIILFCIQYYMYYY